VAFVADVTAMLADFGVNVTLASTTVRGLLSQNRTQLMDGGGGMLDRVPDLLIRTGSLAPTRGASLTLADVGAVTDVTQAYGTTPKVVTVRDVIVEDDGALTRLILAD